MRWSIGVRAGFLVVALVGILAYVVAAATTYTDATGRFSFTVPDGYVQRFRAGTDVSYRATSTQTSTVDVTVIAQSPDPIPTADTIAMNTLKGLNPPAYTPGTAGIQMTLLGGQSARKFDYFTTLEGVPTRTHTLQVVATTTKAAYVLVFSAADTDYDQMLNDTAIVLGSFTFGSAGGTGSVTTGSTATNATPTAAPGATPTTAAVATVTTAANFFATSNPGPTVNPDLAPPPPIRTPVAGPLPVFSISTPTAVVAVGTTMATAGADLAAAPAITTPMPGTQPAFTISTPTAAVAPVSSAAPTGTPSTSGTTPGSDLSTAPPITTPVSGTQPAFTISTPTAVTVGGFTPMSTGAIGTSATGMGAGYSSGFPVMAPQPTRDASRDRN